MRVFDSNWMQIADYLQRDDRIVLPIGSTEQHAYLSLGTDALLAERVSVEAAEPLGVPVLPVLPFGMAPYFTEYPGSMSLRISTYIEVMRDLLDGLASQGFRRIAVVNGHGGTHPSPPHPRMGLLAAGAPGAGPVPQLVQRAEDGGGRLPLRRRPVSRLLAGELRLDQGRRSRDPRWQRAGHPTVDGERRDRAGDEGALSRRESGRGLPTQ
ncbi:creatininase family protein [Streptosporangium lutulentum]